MKILQSIAYQRSYKVILGNYIDKTEEVKKVKKMGFSLFIWVVHLIPLKNPTQPPQKKPHITAGLENTSGEDGARTHDLLAASQAL